MKAEFREREIGRQQQTARGDFDNHSASPRWTRDSLAELRTVTQQDDKLRRDSDDPSTSSG